MCSSTARAKVECCCALDRQKRQSTGAAGGMVPAGIICEIMKDDGTMARVPDLIEFCRTHDLKC